MRMADCHLDRKHYCRGLCERCYGSLRNSPEFVARPKGPRINECGHPDRRHAGHGLCQSCFAIRKRELQGGQGRAARKDRELRSRYGISLAEFHAIFARQGCACALCRKPIERERNRHVDHCHETGMVRGILCFTCNKALGMLGDDVAGLRRALDYVASRGVFVVEQWQEVA